VSDAINHPDYYGGDEPYEVIKVLRAWDLELARGFCWGNLVKYTARAGKKGSTVEDRKKAQWYADELVSIEEELAGKPSKIVRVAVDYSLVTIDWEKRAYNVERVGGGGGAGSGGMGTVTMTNGCGGGGSTRVTYHNHSFLGNCDPGCPGWVRGDS
jgi:hypothetical protein